MDLSPDFQKAVDYLENLVKTTNLEKYTSTGACKDYENMVLSFMRYIRCHHDEKDFYVLPNDNPMDRTVGYIAWHTDENNNEVSQNWWIGLTDLVQCISPIREFIRTPEIRMAAQDIEHFRENLLIMSVHDS